MDSQTQKQADDRKLDGLVGHLRPHHIKSLRLAEQLLSELDPEQFYQDYLSCENNVGPRVSEFIKQVKFNVTGEGRLPRKGTYE